MMTMKGSIQLDELSLGMLYNPLSVRNAPLSGGFSVGEKELDSNSVAERFIDTATKTDVVGSFMDSKIIPATMQSTTSSRAAGRSLDFVAMRDKLMTTLDSRKSV